MSLLELFIFAYAISYIFIDIQEDQNITLQISAEKGKFGFFKSSTTFNLSSDEVYRFPFAVHTNDIYMEITITYPNTTLPGSLHVCEIEAIGMWRNGNSSIIFAKQNSTLFLYFKKWPAYRSHVLYFLLGCLGGFYGTPCRPCALSGCATGECNPLDGSCTCSRISQDGTSCDGKSSINTVDILNISCDYINLNLQKHNFRDHNQISPITQRLLCKVSAINTSIASYAFWKLSIIWFDTNKENPYASLVFRLPQQFRF